MKTFTGIIFILVLCTLSCTKKQDPYNVVLIFADDMGYGDLACYGNPVIKTPNLDQMAANGVKYTQFYVTSPVCSPSRSSLLSGSYPKRLDLHKHVIFPQYRYGINPDETLLPELFKESGYSTACYGKWHLGHQNPFLPLQNGFDEYYGLPFSNDMSRKEQVKRGNTKYPHYLPLMEGNDTLELDPDQHFFTKNLTERCVKFIESHKNEPFFIYFAHPMPHIPIYASESFEGQSRRGLYGDVIEEIDWSAGQILNTLKENNLLDKSFVFFSSDNGPWLPFKTHGGSAGPLRGGKGSTWEGGMREPCIIHWPADIDIEQINDQTAWSTIDILPTLVELCDLNSPNLKIDGQSRLAEFQGIKQALNKPIYYYSSRGLIEGVRNGQWKYLERPDTAYLFNIEEDISEQFNLIKENPALADSLRQVMIDFDAMMTQEMRPHGEL